MYATRDVLNSMVFYEHFYSITKFYKMNLMRISKMLDPHACIGGAIVLGFMHMDCHLYFRPQRSDLENDMGIACICFNHLVERY